MQIERGRLEVVRTKNGLLPQLDFFLTLGKSGFARSFGTAFNDIDGSSYDVTAGLRLELPAGNSAASALHQEVLRAEQARFRVGKSTAFDVALVRRDFIESQIGEIETIVTYRKALIELYRLGGSLLKRRGVEIPGGELVNVSTR
ncbi:MAG: TolC family protein [Gammaproteobacteria bacterium]